MSNFPMDDSDDDEQGWLVSYADLMTLIACFFILMMAFANYDPPGFQKKTEVIASHFKEKAKKIQFDSKEKKSKEKDNENEDVDKKKADASGEMIELKEMLESKTEVKKMTEVTIENKQLVLNFNGNILFAPGQADINDINIALVDAMISLIRDKNPNYRIVIEGHTDDTPLGKGSPFRSNWALSGARASSIAERFEVYGFSPKNIKVLGLGSSMPAKPNRDKEGKIIPKNLKINRRVVIKIIEPIKKGVKLGLGVYFED